MLIDLVGDQLVMPLFNADLAKGDRFKLSAGCSISRLDKSVIEALEGDKVVLGGYETALVRARVGLTFVAGELPFDPPLSKTELVRLGIYCAMLIRLTTDVPVDMPFWFDMDGSTVVMFGATTIRTYSTSGKYLYPLDEGIAGQRLPNLPPRLDALIDLVRKEDIQNRLIRAIDFVSTGYQTRHTAARLVNNVTFLEALFTSTSAEISFQLASAISWYLKMQSPPEERLKMFEHVRDLYNVRSRIVHGDDHTNATRDLRIHLIEAEKLNTEVFNVLLSKNHVDAFSMSEKRRKQELRKLSLGIAGAFS